MPENAGLQQPWHAFVISKNVNDLKDQQIAQNTNSNELSKSDCVLNFLINEYLKNEFFKAEAANISQSAINRELDKLFS